MLALRSKQNRTRRIRPTHRPRGIAVVMVLGLLAITLAISYATLRGQGTTSQLARNNSRALDARAAAQSGLAAAIRKISQNDWAGIDASLSANITNFTWYKVNFATGDTSLKTGDSQYNELPFRVTIESTGYAADPLDTAVRSESRARCVVQLVRKRLLAEPANWSALTNYNVYQYSSKDAFVQFPVRINGPTCLMGRLIFCNEYPNNAPPLDQYLADLSARRLAGLPDDRPFPGTITLRGLATVQQSATVTKLTSKLGMTLIDTADSPTTPLTHPGTVLKYRLYPGGKEYGIPVIQDAYGSAIQNVTLGQSPVDNPLGVFRSSGPLEIKSDVSITGTIITDGGSPEIQITGANVSLKAATLPALYGSSTSYQLPSALVMDDFRVKSGADAQIEGMTVVWDEFGVETGLPTTKFAQKGNLITSALLLRGRSTWQQTPTTWGSDRSAFLAQYLNVADLNRSLYFPDYLEKQKGFTVKPALTFTPDSSGVKPHWHDWSQPVYQPDPADPGLRWEVVRWENNL